MVGMSPPTGLTNLPAPIPQIMIKTKMAQPPSEAAILIILVEVDTPWDSSACPTGHRQLYVVRYSSRASPLLVERLHSVRAAPAAGGDVQLARDLGAQNLAQKGEFFLAGHRVGDRDAGDGAVVFAQADRAVGVTRCPAQVARLVQVARHLADPLPQGCVVGESLRQTLSDARLQLSGALFENVADERLTADG